MSSNRFRCNSYEDATAHRGTGVLVLVLAAMSGSCASLSVLDADQAVRRVLRDVHCRDGAPARLLVDPYCWEGVCGISCAPDRWTPDPK
jgi:hypothetical protein